MDPQRQSHLFRLPVELRIAIYEKVLVSIKTRPLDIARDVWAWKEQPQGCSQPFRARKFLYVLLICRRIHDEAADILYRKNELCLITECTRDLNLLSQVRRRICPIEDYAGVMKGVHSIRLKLFLTRQSYQADVIVHLLSWIQAILAKRHKPLKRMTVELGATSWETCRRRWSTAHKAFAIMLLPSSSSNAGSRWVASKQCWHWLSMQTQSAEYLYSPCLKKTP